MDKQEQAQRFAEILLASGLKGEWDLNSSEAFIGVAGDAWKLADAMQAEADKHSKKESEHRNCSNSLVVQPAGYGFTDSEEWQPDWSQDN